MTNSEAQERKKKLNVIYLSFQKIASTSDFDITVARHVRESTAKEPTVELKDVWPSAGMSCEVEACTSPHFKTFPQYISHWRKRNIPDVRCFKCPGCSNSFDKRCQLKNHAAYHHHV